MVAAISVTNQPNSRETTRGVYYHHHHHSHQNQSSNNVSRPPLLPSERENGVVIRRPKSREVTSRYLSSSISTTTSTSSPSSSSSSSSASSYNSKRCPSPLLSRTAPSLNPSSPLFQKRSQSVERKRSSTVITTPRPITPLPNNAGGDVSVVVTSSKFTSTRSLSVSFQGESFSLPICKTKSVPPPTNSRKVTPERRRATPLRGGGGGGGGGAKVDGGGGGGGGGDQMENSKKFDQLRWPGRSRQVNPLTKSMDSIGEKKKVVGSGMGVPALQQSMVIDEGTRVSIDECRLQNDAELGNSVQVSFDAVSVHSSSSGSPVPTVLNASDTESVSSGSNSSLQEFVGITRAHSIPDGIIGISVPARFWQETNSRMRRLHDLSSPLSKMIDSRTMAPPKLIPSKKVFMDNPVSSPRTVSASRALSSPLRGGPIRPLSPSKLMVSSAPSPSRGMPSPSRGQSPSKMRNSVVGPMSTQLNNTPSILSFASDVRRGKMGENRIADAHLLRLLYNRHLQWRFVNARSDFAVFVQSLTAEKNLYNAWVTTSELRRSVTLRRIKLQLLRQSLKISSMLKGQMTYLEEWVLLERDHSSSLSGAIESLKASTLRLPVVGGARAEILNVKDAVGSAVDVMQAMASSICSLLPKVEEVNALVAELANVSALERNLLDQCRDLLSTLAAMQINHCSLRTHKLQLERIPSTKSLTMQL